MAIGKEYRNKKTIVLPILFPRYVFQSPKEGGGFFESPFLLLTHLFIIAW